MIAARFINAVTFFLYTGGNLGRIQGFLGGSGRIRSISGRRIRMPVGHSKYVKLELQW